MDAWPFFQRALFLERFVKGRHPGIAVVLAGLNADGSAALKSFKVNGGVTIAQMPEAAIETGQIDYVLAPQQIAARLENIAQAARQTASS